MYVTLLTDGKYKKGLVETTVPEFCAVAAEESIFMHILGTVTEMPPQDIWTGKTFSKDRIRFSFPNAETILRQFF